MTLEQVQLQFHDQYLLTRSIQRLINSVNFQNIFPYLTLGEKYEIQKAIKALNKKEIEKIIDQKLEEQNENENVKDLRETARDLGIRDYQNMTKASLLSEIFNARRN